MEDALYTSHTISYAKNRNAVGHSKIEVRACALNDTTAIFSELRALSQKKPA